MAPIRVLIVDDSVLVRRLLSETFASCPKVEVAGIAASGEIALARIPLLKPDVVTLNIEMPGVDGIQALTQIRKRYPTLPVIICSPLTERTAAVTVEALSLGASDYVTIPRPRESLASASGQMPRELIEKILSLGRRTASGDTLLPDLGVPRMQITGEVSVLAIGASTGGPNALTQVIPSLPKDFPVPVVVVQHMPPLFTRSLAERLDSQSALPVREAEDGQALEPGGVWIAPGDFHMSLANRGRQVVIALNQNPPENFCRPAVDVLFRSVASVYGANTLALVMTGMGSDGARGALRIRHAGGEILVQDEASSVVWGMPRAVVNAGAADKICPLADIRMELIRRVTAGKVPDSLVAAAKN